MTKKNLDKCRSGKDFLAYAGKQANIEWGKGSHAKVKTEKGICIIPHHNKDLGKGLHSVILKTLLRIGVMGFIAMFIFCYLYG